MLQHRMWQQQQQGACWDESKQKESGLGLQTACKVGR